MAKLKVPIALAEDRIVERIDAGHALLRGMQRLVDGDTHWLDDYQRWSTVSEAMLESVYEGDEELDAFQSAKRRRYNMAADRPVADRTREGVELLSRAINLLVGLRESLIYADGPDRRDGTKAVPLADLTDERRSIFVVHGHSDTLRERVARVIERTTGTDVTILGEEEIAGLTILEKFERFAAQAGFAVVLLTADDFGKPAGQERGWNDRARQNVVFEMGWFFGRLGRDRVAAIYDPTVELPSDLHGLAYIEHDESGAWKSKLAKQLKAAGVEVDVTRMP